MQLSRTALLIGICVLVALAAAVLSSPAERASAHHVAAISMSGQHSCALTTAGGVQCWGRNQFGQLGDGTFTDRSIPVEVVGLESGVIAVASGAVHTCAVTVDGGVKCWGANGLGALGNGESGASIPTPVDVVGLQSGVTAVVGGFHHTCALTAGGRVKCWGLNQYGELGAPSVDECDGWICSLSPVDVLESDEAPLTGAVAIASGGGFHNCILTEEGGVKCWGKNSDGQLGDGTTDGVPCGLSGAESCRANPEDVVGLSSDVAAISAGEEHTCALTTAGGLKCWGVNGTGRLGDGTTATYSATPVDVVGLDSGVAAVDGGGLHTCALIISGGVKCWGMNLFGQVDGSPSFANVLTPVDAPLTSGVAAVSAGLYHSCALTDGGGVFCWGGDDYGQSGDTDGDGCTDFAEHGSDPAAGGLRDHTHYWDFFDTPDADNVRDKAVAGSDISGVVARFGSTGDPAGNPLAPPPPAPGYHTAFDRGGQGGPYAWNLAPADGAVVGGDISAVVAQFGHACA